MGSSNYELPASRGVKILPLAQESATNQSSSGEQSLGLAWGWLTLLGDLVALLRPWASNSPHLNLVVGAVVDVVTLGRNDLLHVARPFSQSFAAIWSPAEPGRANRLAADRARAG
jgi:hypothetical protein